MTTRDLITSLAISQNQLLYFLNGFDEELAFRFPEGGGNPLFWILGHILTERLEAITEVAGAEHPDGVPDLSQYVTGTTPNPDTSLTFAELKGLIPVTYEVQLAAIKAIPEAELDTRTWGTLLGKPASLGQQLLTYSLHEMYHIGQISLLRRVLGMGAAG
ncbi:DinB family protein [bacterium]|nr:DinB family protein [bacterium]